MFGEEIITESKTIKIDTKNRIVVPKFTLREPNDELLIMYGLMKEKLIIGNIDSMYKKLDEIEQALISTGFLTDKYKYEYERILNIKRFLYGARCITEEKIDKNMRLLLPKHALETLNFGNQIFVVGNENRLDLYKDEETYLKYKRV